MIIKKLQLHNFGVYASDNVIELNNEKPVVLIGGLNGRGKTTFLEAILLALYGSNSFAFIESKYKSYGAYLKAHVNLEDGSKSSFVELEFSLNNDKDNNVYIVRRSWDLLGKRVHDRVRVCKNGEENKFLAKNWIMFIESVLPSALSSFFFFDGEKIAEIADNETGKQMKESIKSLLGINVLDRLESDLNKITKKYSKKQEPNIDLQRLEELRDKKSELESQLEEIDERLKHAKEEKEKLERNLLEMNNELQKKGGEVEKNFDKLYKDRIEIETRLQQKNNLKLDIANSELPLLLVKPLLINIQEKVKNEKEDNNVRIAVNEIASLFALFEQNNSVNSELNEFITFVKEKASTNNESVVYNFSDISYIQINELLNGKLSSIVDEYKSCLDECSDLLRKKDEFDNYLSTDIDEVAIKRIYKSIKDQNYKIIDVEDEIGRLEKKRSTINGEYIRINSEFSKSVENSLAAMERKNDIERILNYSVLASKVTLDYKIVLQKEKISLLAETMTDCYRKLLGKKNLIDRIEMNPETLDYYFLDRDGVEVPKKSLSAGEKQLMVISMLWALAICSKRKLPVIIDTPMARLDSFHRNALIERYFPFASDQTIILSTDSEIDHEYYELIKKSVSNEFTLVYDEKNKCTRIEKGYFQEESND